MHHSIELNACIRNCFCPVSVNARHNCTWALTILRWMAMANVHGPPKQESSQWCSCSHPLINHFRDILLGECQPLIKCIYDLGHLFCLIAASEGFQYQIMIITTYMIYDLILYYFGGTPLINQASFTNPGLTLQYRTMIRSPIDSFHRSQTAWVSCGFSSSRAESVN